MRTPLTLSLTAFLASFAILGCGVDPKAQITSTKTTHDASLPTGWKRVVAKGEHLSIAVPPSWKAIDMTGDDINKMADSAAKLDPDTAAMKSQIQMAASNKAIKMFVFHKVEKVKFAPNINIIETPNPNVSFDELVQANADQLKTIEVGAPTKESLQIAGHDGVLLKGQMPIKGIDGLPKVNLYSYLTVIKDNVYYITFTVPPGSSAEGDVASIIKTFEAG